jgi:hypothetical protein
MLVFSALGPTEYVVLIVAIVGAVLGFSGISRVMRSHRKIDECHSMLMELVQKSRGSGV